MKITLEIKDETFNGQIFKALYVVIDEDYYYLGTLKGSDFKFIRTISKKEK